MQSRTTTNVLLGTIALLLLAHLWDRPLLPEAVAKGETRQVSYGCYEAPRNPCKVTPIRVDELGRLIVVSRNR